MNQPIPAWAAEPTSAELYPADVTEGEIAEHLAALWARDGRSIPLDSDEYARSIFDSGEHPRRIFLTGHAGRVYEVAVTDVTAVA